MVNLFSGRVWKFYLSLPLEDKFLVLRQRFRRKQGRIKKVSSYNDIFPGDFDEYIREEYKRVDKKRIVETANDVLKNNFDILGSGKKSLGSDINWRRDFKTGKEWKNVHISEIKYTDWYNGSDPKVMWDLSRFNFVTTLGYAYWFTKEKRYAKKFAFLVEDWIKKNRVYYGINWRCTMDVSIRACNWILGLYFFKDCFEKDFLVRLLNSLAVHGDFIYNNLEYTIPNNNHYLANVTGLLFIGCLFSNNKLIEKGVKSFEREMERQVYKDGVDFEGSIPYHRLVTEFFGYSGLLCMTNNIRLSKKYWDKLSRMFDFIRHYTPSNNLAPQIGDNDDGRLFIFESDYAGFNRRDHSYMLRLGKRLGFKEGKAGTKGFFDSGVFIFRDEEYFCLVEASENGQNGNGGHGHNDTLSFVLNKKGKEFLVDNGTYVYTANPELRNKFRSTSMHNTVKVDKKEMNSLNEGLYKLGNNAIPRINSWNLKDFLDVEHNSYPVSHGRKFFFNGGLSVTDFFNSEKEHFFEWNFHLHPDVEISKGKGLILDNKGVKLKFEYPEFLNPAIKDSEYSPMYGVKVKSKRIYFSFKGKLKEAKFRIE